MKIIDYTRVNKLPVNNGQELRLIGYSILVTYNKNQFPLRTDDINKVEHFVNTLNVLHGENYNTTSDYIQVYVDKDFPYDADLTVALKIALRTALDINPFVPHHITAVAYLTKDRWGDNMVLIYPTTTSLQGVREPYTTYTHSGSPVKISTDDFNRAYIMQ